MARTAKVLEHGLRLNYVFTHDTLLTQLRQSFNDPHLSIQISRERGKPGVLEVTAGRAVKKLAVIPVFRLGVLIPKMTAGGHMPPIKQNPEIYHQTQRVFTTHSRTYNKTQVKETIIAALAAVHSR